MKLSTLLARLAEGTASADEQLAASVWMQRAHDLASEVESTLCDYENEPAIVLRTAEAQDLYNLADDLASDYVEMDEGDRAPFFGSEGGAA